MVSTEQNFEVAHRLEGIEEYYFAQKLKQIEQMNASGEAVINLGIGSPDLPPPPAVIETLQKEAALLQNHAYQSYRGAPKLREAVAAWYQKYYQVTLDPATEILPLMGSKEGIMHLCMTYVNAGDTVLVPNPGYPTYASAAMLAGANVVRYRLQQKNHWWPQFDELEELVQKAGRVPLLFVNYPHMPTGQLAIKDLFEQLVAFARRHHILICHDNPYSFILNEQPLSMLAVEGAKDVVVELNSLSKSHNMAGWRVGMLCGHRQRINDVLRFKSNMDSGMFLPVQLAAARALNLDDAWYRQLNEVYSRRRQKISQLLQLLGCSFENLQAGLFIWARVPQHYADGYALSDALLEQARVFITPGGIFGSEGNAFIRASLCSKEEVIEEAISRIKNYFSQP